MPRLSRKLLWTCSEVSRVLLPLSRIVTWELTRLLRARGRVRRLGWPLAVLALLLVPQGILYPNVIAAQASVVALACWPLAILFLPLSDSFAGERERGTLETLLLLPVPDWAIPAGKLVLLCSFGLIYLCVLVVCHAVVVYATLGQHLPLIWYAASLGLGLAGYPLLVSLGLFVSWSVSSVQAAQAITVYVPFVALVGVGTALAKFGSSAGLQMSGPPSWAGPVGIAALAVISTVAVLTVLSRFQRHRLLVRCR